MDIKTKLFTLLAVVLMISCHKDKTPDNELPVFKEGIYSLFCYADYPKPIQNYYYIKNNKIYQTKSSGTNVPACLYRVSGIIKVKNDSTTERSEIFTGYHTTADSCQFDNDKYGDNYGIYYLSEGKIEQFGSNIYKVTGTFTFDLPGYHKFGTYIIDFLHAYPQ